MLRISSYIGADFLRHYSLLVDVTHNRLVDSWTQLQVQGIAVQEQLPSPTILPKHPTTEFEAIPRDSKTLHNRTANQALSYSLYQPY